MCAFHNCIGLCRFQSACCVLISPVTQRLWFGIAVIYFLHGQIQPRHFKAFLHYLRLTVSSRHSELCFAVKAFPFSRYRFLTSMDLHHTVPGHIPGGCSCPLCVLFAVCIFVDFMILPLSAIITEKKLRTFLLSATFLFYKSFFYQIDKWIRAGHLYHRTKG